jgi:hypothetical protein
MLKIRTIYGADLRFYSPRDRISSDTMIVPLMYRKCVVAQVRYGCDSGGGVDGV